MNIEIETRVATTPGTTVLLKTNPAGWAILPIRPTRRIQRLVSVAYRLRNRRTANPAKPNPSNVIEAGSGTILSSFPGWQECSMVPSA